MTKKELNELKKLIKDEQSNTIQYCNFNGVNFDSKATEAINNIALASLENARTLGKLSEVLKAGNVHIDTMIKIPINQ